MPTTTLNPTAVGTDNAWTLGAGANKFAAVTEPDDENDTFISTTGNVLQGFVMDDLPSEATTVIAHETKRRVGMASGTGDTDTFLRLSGSYTHSAVTAEPTVYNTRLNTDLAKPGGGTYSDPADVNNSELGVRSSNMLTTPQMRCTTLRWNVTWDAPGGFAIFVGSLIGGAIGSAVGLHEIPKLAAYLARITGRKHILRPYEHETLWRELSLPRRRYVF